MSDVEKTASQQRPIPSRIHEFVYFDEITTRWNDNDVYGHMNNAVHYSLFDSVVNRWLHDIGKQDAHRANSIGLVVHSSCDYYTQLAYPEKIIAGLCIERLGETSVTYRVALFSERQEICAAEGLFIHVYVDRETRKSTSISVGLRANMERLCRPILDR